MGPPDPLALGHKPPGARFFCQLVSVAALTPLPCLLPRAWALHLYLLACPHSLLASLPPFLISSSCPGTPHCVPQYGGRKWELLFLWIMIFFSPSFSCLGSACASKILLSPFSRYTWALGGGFCAISSHESMIWVAWLPSYQSTQHELCPILGFPLRTILPQRMASLPHKRF